MLKVHLHAADPRHVRAQNLIGRLDIGYEKLDATADYKAVMLTTGLGEQAPVKLTSYPRWSASVWDLVARIVCLSLSTREAVWPADIPVQRKGAYIEDMTAVIEHWPDGFEVRRKTVATAHVAMMTRRCNYRATFEDDLMGRQVSDVFRHTPPMLTPWDLLTRAFAQVTTETFALPPRPRMCLPIAIAEGDESYVALETLTEPARTGFYRWMDKQGIEPVALTIVDSPCVTEKQFTDFLRFAV